MRVLVAGADGFIGRQVAAELAAVGHEVIAGVRRPDPSAAAAGRAVACDFARDLDSAAWRGRLDRVDAVVNCIGILRERGDNTFQRIHVDAPLALWRACQSAGVRRIVQISSLGSPDDGPFVASKHAGDAALDDLETSWTVLRPSVVYSPRGSYGGTSLLRAMAALPGVLFVPGSGTQRIDPVDASDLAALVAKLLATGEGIRQIVEVVGPETLTIREYLEAWRRWLAFPPARIVAVPRPLIQIAIALSEHFGSGPLTRTIDRMLSRGNAGAPGAVDRLSSLLGRRPQSLTQSLAAQPSFVQDRWHARLYFLGPALRVLLAFVWLGSGLAGFVGGTAAFASVIGRMEAEAGAALLVYAASTVDVVLGLALLAGFRPKLVGALMFASVLAYTLYFTIVVPGAWLEPLGGVLKNLVLLPAILVMMALADRR